MAKRLSGYAAVPSTVLVGLPDKPALEALIERLNRYNIPHAAYHEPDFGPMGLSAVATEPLTSSRHRKAMFIYETWKENP
jgi:hypothetical protein